MTRTSNAIAPRTAAAREGICLFERSAIAGTRHVENIEDLVSRFDASTRFFLERDRGNLFDEWAVGVFDDQSNRIGYVSCECNEVIARLLDGGKSLSARFAGANRSGRWMRIEMGVYLND